MKKALINIDYTNDFVAEDGKLTCGKPGQDIENEILKITNEFITNDDFVVFAIDCHNENDLFHPESSLFPPHNIVGTDGRLLYGKLNELYGLNKNNKNVLWLDKTRYSAFVGTDLEIQLRARNITDLTLVGVCTDICVLHTAVDAYNKGFNVTIVEKAVASFDEIGHKWALNHFKNTLGFRVI